MAFTFKTGKSGIRKTLELSAARGLMDSGTPAKVREKRVCPHCGKEAGIPLSFMSVCLTCYRDWKGP